MSDSQGDTSKKRGGASGLILGGAVTLFLTFALLFAIFFFTNRHSVEYNQYLHHVGQLRILSQTMLSSAAQAARGDANAFTTLNADLQEFDRHWNILQKGDAKLGAVPRRGLFKEMDDVQNTWAKLRTNLTKISNAQLTVISYHQVAEALAESAPQIQNEYEQLGTVLEHEGAPVPQLRLIDHQALLVERLFRIVNILRTGGVDLEQAVGLFRKQAVELDHNYNVLTKGGNGVPAVTSAQGIKHLREIASLSEFLSGISDEVNGTAPEMVEVSEADKAAYVTAQTLLKNLTALGDGLQKGAQSRVLVIVGYLVGLFALSLIAFLYFRTQSELRQEVKETTEENERNQAAILRLLDEIADLADGDLTVRATVSEAFTGTIADSINTSVEQLRVLVRAINKATSRVAVAISETQKTAQSLAAASQHQAKAITGASKAINDMARSIDQVSADAAKSTEVAERSVTIANNGNQVVKNTITGMTTIREQIQDTSKRIKRLGESSQEIGDIISLINDISEQTNVLALNAAIQASMAGESGRGFAVVADEVQHLAERSSNASKQIEVLVKTIQSDTNEAIISMEQTTTEVVRGANLAQNAGVALEEIEKVSKSLAALIEGISSAARKQAVDAGNISEAMKVILDFTSQTSAGTKTTARSIAGLAEMAAELRESASDFTLPEEDEND